MVDKLEKIADSLTDLYKNNLLGFVPKIDSEIKSYKLLQSYQNKTTDYDCEACVSSCDTCNVCDW